jgi:hypothetical protein
MFISVTFIESDCTCKGDGDTRQLFQHTKIFIIGRNYFIVEATLVVVALVKNRKL